MIFDGSSFFVSMKEISSLILLSRLSLSSFLLLSLKFIILKYVLMFACALSFNFDLTTLISFGSMFTSFSNGFKRGGMDDIVPLINLDINMT